MKCIGLFQNVWRYLKTASTENRDSAAVPLTMKRNEPPALAIMYGDNRLIPVMDALLWHMFREVLITRSDVNEWKYDFPTSYKYL